MGSRDAARGQKAVDALQHMKVTLLVLDVSRRESIQEAARQLASQVDHLDVLVNNAGVYLDKQAAGLEVDPDVILDTFSTNTLGPLLVTRALAPLLAKAGGAQVINVSSGMGQLSEMEGGSAGYRISKAGLNAVTRVLAKEFADKGVAVNSICPGWVKTDMGGAGAHRTPEQGADTIVWLASGQAGNKSGHFFRDRKQIAW